MRSPRAPSGVVWKHSCKKKKKYIKNDPLLWNVKSPGYLSPPRIRRLSPPRIRFHLANNTHRGFRALVWFFFFKKKKKIVCKNDKITNDDETERTKHNKADVLDAKRNRKNLRQRRLRIQWNLSLKRKYHNKVLIISSLLRDVTD